MIKLLHQSAEHTTAVYALPTISRRDDGRILEVQFGDQLQQPNKCCAFTRS